jgi:hypothetical protein
MMPPLPAENDTVFLELYDVVRVVRGAQCAGCEVPKRGVDKAFKRKTIQAASTSRSFFLAGSKQLSYSHMQVVQTPRTERKKQ